MTLIDLNRALTNMRSLVNNLSQPNVNELWTIAKDLEFVKLNLKFFGYEMARQLTAGLPKRENLEPYPIELRCKPSTQADLTSDWAAHWANELQTGIIMHRKLWEWVYAMQAIWQHDLLTEGKRALGFGCGSEPMASYLAAHGVHVTVTDLPPDDQASQGWAATNQHATSLDTAFAPHLVSREQFDEHVSLRHVDMNAIPDDLVDYDLTWSICALEHLGSIEHGLRFVENAMRTLRPGGLAVHTTEFNFLDNENTVDNWPTVLFQRRHFEQLAARLRAQGHWVAELDFDVGDEPMDKFIDLPPYMNMWPSDPQGYHLKLAHDGFATTCFGLMIKKGG